MSGKTTTSKIDLNYQYDISEVLASKFHTFAYLFAFINVIFAILIIDMYHSAHIDKNMIMDVNTTSNTTSNTTFVLEKMENITNIQDPYFDSPEYKILSDGLYSFYVSHILVITFGLLQAIVHMNMSIFLYMGAMLGYIFVGLVIQIIWLSQSSQTHDDWKDKAHDYWLVACIETVFYWCNLFVTFAMLIVTIVSQCMKNRSEKRQTNSQTSQTNSQTISQTNSQTNYQLIK